MDDYYKACISVQLIARNYIHALLYTAGGQHVAGLSRWGG